MACIGVKINEKEQRLERFVTIDESTFRGFGPPIFIDGRDGGATDNDSVS